MATKKKIEWPTAVVLSVMLASLAAVYVLVPDHRDGIMAGVTALGSVVLAVMRPMLVPAPAPAPRPRRERETDAPPPGDA